MFESASHDLERVNEADWQTPDELLAKEDELLGYDHARLGALVCERWHLPELLIEVVRLHHARVLPPQASAGALGEDLRVVRLADAVAMFVDHHPEMLTQPPAAIVKAMTPSVSGMELGSNALVLAHVARHLQVTMREAMEAFGQWMAG